MRPQLRCLLGSLLFFTIILGLTAGDCTSPDERGTTNVPVKPYPPANVNVTMRAIPGGESFALVTWTGSTDETYTTFYGYRVSTFIVDSAGSPLTYIRAISRLKAEHADTINVQRGTRYRSYVSSIFDDGTMGDSTAGPIYGGIFYNTDGVIDEYSDSISTKSGYGWNIGTGVGTPYEYNETNAQFIDLHMRRDTSNILMFYSPNLVVPGSKTTFMETLGISEPAFDLPGTSTDSTALPVTLNKVYMLRTNEGYYIKILVREIASIGVVPPYSKVKFEYKVQPILGLRF